MTYDYDLGNDDVAVLCSLINFNIQSVLFCAMFSMIRLHFQVIF